MDNEITSYPFLKNSSIEKETLELMKSYAEKTGKIVKAPIPVFDLIEYLGYNVDFRSDGIYEDDNILDTLNDVQQVLLKNKINGEIIVVNDGSTDKTKQLVLKEIKKDELIKLINHKVNKGIGSYFWTGYKNTKG